MFYSRLDWQAREPRATTPIEGTARIAIHYEGAHSNGDIEAVQAIQNYHMDRNGWNDIAYSFLVNQSGDVFEGRGWDNRSAANGSVSTNKDFYAVCVLIGPDDAVTQESIESVRGLVAQARGHAPNTPTDIVGHRDLIATSCPGDALYGLVQDGVFEPDYGQVWVNDEPVVQNPPVLNPLAELADGVLQAGEHGVWVQILQNRLISLGFSVGKAGADGAYGFDTANAVRDFQRQAGITDDGVAGKQTFAKLDEWENNKRKAVPPFPGLQMVGSYDRIVTALIQQKLNDVAGTNLAVDGIYGPATFEAVKRFQRFFGANVDGIVGKQTWALLAGSPSDGGH